MSVSNFRPLKDVSVSGPVTRTAALLFSSVVSCLAGILMTFYSVFVRYSPDYCDGMPESRVVCK